MFCHFFFGEEIGDGIADADAADIAASSWVTQREAKLQLGMIVQLAALGVAAAGGDKPAVLIVDKCNGSHVRLIVFHCCQIHGLGGLEDGEYLVEHCFSFGGCALCNTPLRITH